MKIAHYSHIGKKPVNEDCLGHNNRALIVCDGVGGAPNGELASSFVLNYLLNKTANTEFSSEQELNELILEVQDELTKFSNNKDGLIGTATTLALIYLSKQGLFTAHMGDTRIILVKRRIKEVWQTWDHSVVSTMIKMGEITHKEAGSHPLKNQITNAIISNQEGNRKKPEIHMLSDIEMGDLGFICSDGVLESYDELELFDLLASDDLSLIEKMSQIRIKCEANSVDNNSAILVEFEANDLKDFSKYPSNWKKINSYR